jgi:hypothetical protein
MEKFTQLGLSGKTDKKPQDNKKSEEKKVQNTGKTLRHGISDKKAMAFVGTVVLGAVAGIFLLQTGGCSREDAKPVASSPNTVTFNPAPAPVPPSVPTTQTVAKPVKKVVKKPPTTVTYNDPNYGVSFRYPRKYTLMGSDNNDQTRDLMEQEQVAMNFVQSGGLAVAKVEVPKGTFLGSDLSYAAFNLNVNKTLTEDECYQFALPGADGADSPAASPSKVKLGVMEFQEVENLSGPVTRQSDAKYYHVYDNDACYEFALGLETEDGTEEELTPVNREEVFQKLEKILASVKIKPQATAAQTAAAPTAAPSALTSLAK